MKRVPENDRKFHDTECSTNCIIDDRRMVEGHHKVESLLSLNL